MSEQPEQPDSKDETTTAAPGTAQSVADSAASPAAGERASETASEAATDLVRDTARDDARIDTLELKLMDLENTVQELNDVILRQYRDIDLLQRQQSELMNRLHGGGPDSAATPSLADELPPHY